MKAPSRTERRLLPKERRWTANGALDQLIERCGCRALDQPAFGVMEFNSESSIEIVVSRSAKPSDELGLRTIGTRPPDRTGRSYGNNLPLSVFEAGSGSRQENASKKTAAGSDSIRTEMAITGAIVVSNRIRTVLALGALAAFGAVEIAVIYGVVGAVVELTLGMDVPLIGLVDASDDPSSSGCT